MEDKEKSAFATFTDILINLKIPTLTYIEIIKAATELAIKNYKEGIEKGIEIQTKYSDAK